jgi:hypothetical protein
VNECRAFLPLDEIITSSACRYILKHTFLQALATVPCAKMLKMAFVKDPIDLTYVYFFCTIKPQTIPVL